MIFSFGSSVCKCFEDSTYFVIGVLAPDFLQKFYNYTDFWITVLRTAHYVINDFVFFLLNFVVDIVLVVSVRKDLAQKKKLTKKMTKKSKENYKKIDEIKKAQDDTSKLIIFTFFLLVICRIPELAFELHFLFINLNESMYSYNSLCLTTGLCSTLKDNAQFLYMFTYCLNILLYYRFNKNFRLAFKYFFKLDKQYS